MPRADPTCPICEATGIGPKKDLYPCRGCGVVRFCSLEHEISYGKYHKRICSRIENAKRNCEKEEWRLRNYKNQYGKTLDFLKCLEAHWYNNAESEIFAKSIYVLVGAILWVDTYAAVDQAYKYSLKALYHQRNDTLGFSNLIPALCLRLGRDQEAFDFCEWWIRTRTIVSHKQNSPINKPTLPPCIAGAHLSSHY